MPLKFTIGQGIRGFASFFLFGVAEASFTELKRCPEALQRLVEEIQSASAGFTETSPFDTVAQHYPDLKPDLDALVSATLPLLLSEPQSPETLREVGDVYGLRESAIREILDFYRLRISSSFSPQSVLAAKDRAMYLCRARRLEGTQSKLRLLYYILNLTNLSIPEMAAELELSEGVVRNELTTLGLSPWDEFQRVRPYTEREKTKITTKLQEAGSSFQEAFDPRLSLYDQAAALFTKQMPVPQIAKILGVGEQALLFTFSYQGLIHSGNSWKTKIGPEQIELIELVRKRYAEDQTCQAIADEINALTGAQTKDPEFRTASAVSGAIYRYNISASSLPSYPRDVRTPDQKNYFKKDGLLVPEQVIPFLKANTGIHPRVLAHRLGVAPRSLRNFIFRHQLNDLFTLAPPSILTYPADIPTPDGQAFFKKSGELVPDQVIPFLREHASESINELAHQLGVEPSSLRGFIFRHQLIPHFPAGTFRRSAFANNLAVLDDAEVAEYILENPLVSLAKIAGHFEAPPATLEAWLVQNPSVEETRLETVRAFSEDFLEQVVRAGASTWSTDPKTALLKFARSQVTAHYSDPLETKLNELPLYKTDFDNARQGKADPIDRLFAHFALIAETKAGNKPSQLTQKEGSEIFGFAPLPSRSPRLTEDQVRVFLSTDEGLLVQFQQNKEGNLKNAPAALLHFAQSQLEGDKLNPVLEKIGALKIPPTAFISLRQGHLAPCQVIHEAFMLIAEAKEGTRPSVLNAKLGTRLFAFPPVLPKLSKPQEKAFTEGLLAQVAQLEIPGWKKNSPAAIETFTRLHLSDPEETQRKLARLKQLGIKNEDGTYAEQGTPNPLGRLHEAFKVIAECSLQPTDPSSDFLWTSTLGTQAFGLPPIFPALTQQELANAIQSESGLLSHFANQNGWKEKANEKLIALAKQQVTHDAKQALLLKQLKWLQIKDRDFDDATRKGNEKSILRLLKAFSLIAAAKDSPSPKQTWILTLEGGEPYFGIQKPRSTASPATAQ